MRISEKQIRHTVEQRTQGWRFTACFDREDVEQVLRIHLFQLEQLPETAAQHDLLLLRKAWFDTLDEIRTSQGWRQPARLRFKNVSLEERMSEESSDSDTNRKHAAALVAPGDVGEDVCARLTAVELLQHLFTDISPRERMICELRLQGVSMREIGSKLEVTESRISQILSHLEGKARAKRSRPV